MHVEILRRLMDEEGMKRLEKWAGFFFTSVIDGQRLL
jgi:hypothetical protein